MHSEISNISQLKVVLKCAQTFPRLALEQKTMLMGVVRLLLGKMAVNRDQKFKLEAVHRNIIFI